MSVGRVAAILGVSERTVRRWLASGQLNHFKLASGGVRVSGVHLEQFMGAAGVAEAEAITDRAGVAR